MYFFFFFFFFTILSGRSLCSERDQQPFRHGGIIDTFLSKSLETGHLVQTHTAFAVGQFFYLSKLFFSGSKFDFFFGFSGRKVNICQNFGFKVKIIKMLGC